MVQLLAAAFTMGMLGSFHCVGMCGPLALSLPLSNNSYWAKFSGAFLYNAGRAVTYAVFGLVFGLIGQSAAFFGYQQWLSVILGALIILFILLPKRFTAFRGTNAITRFFESLRSALGKLFVKKNYASLFLIGLMNGLLPCGLVYMAVAGAVATGAVSNAVLFMVFFGLGTLPVMWSIAFWGNFVSNGIRQKIRRAYPYMMMLMACLLILRGMGLGIPYVSPKMGMDKKEAMHCMPVPD
ncbi:MAG: sulfite exporter TauE/SafE family protein [Bacteroidetes bacterium]|nr:sulfite exporter TauE/SafE family protein [Bacteroidota bacterium]